MPRSKKSVAEAGKKITALKAKRMPSRTRTRSLFPVRPLVGKFPLARERRQHGNRRNASG